MITQEMADKHRKRQAAQQAAVDIAALQAENERLREALERIRTHRANGEAQIFSGREAQIYRWRRMGDIAIAALEGDE